MERYKRQVPEGTQDTLMEECYHKRQMEERVMRTFRQAGYDEVETPTFEYYDVFASGIGAVRQEKVQKFIDARGRILVLRPDITMPIARLAATQLQNADNLRLCYLGNAYGTDDAFYGEQREFTQAGVELLGVNGPESDAELISIAIEALNAAGLSEFTIELGQVEFFKGLMESAGIDTEIADRLRAFVDEKNMLGLELLLRQLKVDDEFRSKVKRLTSLYGGVEVFEEAFQFSDNVRCRAALQNLRSIYDTLCDFGLQDHVQIDLGMLQSLDYYSGVVFKGISAQIGQPVLSGGRYDALLSDFGRDMPATGFSVNINRVLVALDRQSYFGEKPGVDIMISALPEFRAKAYQKVKKLHLEGKRVILALNLDKQSLYQEAEKKSAEAIFIEE